MRRSEQASVTWANWREAEHSADRCRFFTWRADPDQKNISRPHPIAYVVCFRRPHAARRQRLRRAWGAVRDQASDPRATHRISMTFIINICCFVERRKDRSYTDLLVVCSNPSMSRSQGELAAVERMATYISVVPSTRNNSCISVVKLHGTSLNLSLFFNQLKSTW
jgi:hypothetical protein